MEALSNISVKAKNFKSFEQVSFSPTGLNTIIGTNASGKSNLFDIFKFLDSVGSGKNLRSLLGGSDKAGLKIRGSLDQLYRKGSNTIEISFSFTKDFLLPVFGNSQRLKTNHVKYTIKLRRDALKITHISEEVSVRRGKHHYKYDARLQMAALAAYYKTEDTLKDYEFAISKGSKLMNLFLEELTNITKNIELKVKDKDTAKKRIELEKINDQLKLASANGIFMFTVGEINQSLRGIEFLEPDPSQMRIYNSIGDYKIGSRGENISSALFSIYSDDEKRKSILSWVSRISNCEFTDIIFDFDINGDVIALLIDESGNLTPISSASDGTLRFMAILVKLHQIDENSLMFIEEIENGLHPTRVSYALQMVDEISSLKNLRCCITTHSPMSLLFNHQNNSSDRTYISYKDETKGVTKLIQLNSLPNIEKILETEDISRLFFSGWMEDAIYFMDKS